MSKAELVVVSQNKNKLAEISPLFREHNVEFETSSLEKQEVRSDEVQIVARSAAEHAFRILKRPVVTDDTGLYIDALNGFPRAYPSFVLDTIGKEGVLKLMDGVSDRSAKFITAAAFCDGRITRAFVGEMQGSIASEAAGSGGFGYDPIFIPEGHSKTYAQLSFDEKVAISHRTRSFRAFLVWYVAYRQGLRPK
jgi:XTP/dITP diphosphohydrolase